MEPVLKVLECAVYVSKNLWNFADKLKKLKYCIREKSISSWIYMPEK